MTDQRTPHAPAPPPADWDAIARFLAGECAPAEAREIRQWIGQNGQDAGLVVALDNLLTQTVALKQPFALDTSHSPMDVEGALTRAHHQLNFSDETRRSATAGSQKLRSRATPGPARRAPWLGVALATAATLVVAFTLSRDRSPAQNGTQAAATYQTNIGVRDSVILPDGSRVLLAPGSRLLVAAGYGNGRRDVELQGAGQFTVHHDESRPFTVRSGRAVIRDLGTVFTVKTMATSAVAVMVTEGSVTLSDSTAPSGRAVELKAGDHGRLNVDGSVALERGSVTPDATAWVTGTLVYRDAPTAEVQADLRRWYGVELVVTDPALAKTFTGRFNNEPVSLVLRIIAETVGGDLTQRGDSAFIGTRAKSRH